MPLLHCDDCHHEWETINVGEKCDWCGGESYMLEEETQFEKYCKTTTHRCSLSSLRKAIRHEINREARKIDKLENDDE